MAAPTSSDLRDHLQATFAGTLVIERELGRGGMSRVFVAEEIALGRRIVLKVLTPDAAAELSAERFAREITVSAGLQHPNIVPVLTAGSARGVPYYTMPYVDGESLRARLARHSPHDRLPVDMAINVLRDVARALAYAHGRGVVHRDIKPDNVLVSDGIAVVADFGISKALDAARGVRSVTQAIEGEGTSALTAIGTSIGTPAYMSPEQVVGDPGMDHRADLYAWGIVAYELLAGEHPFANRSSHAMLLAHVSEQPRSLDALCPELPRSLVALAMRCLAKEPDGRPADAQAIMDVLAEPAAPRHRGSSANPVARESSAGFVRTAEKSVAVMPFVNMGAEADTEYFSDGITEDIINALAHLPGVRVSARTSSFAFKGKSVDIADVGAKLNVAAVLEGSVRRAGNRLRISVQLINVADGFQLWSERFDRELEDVFAIQDEVSRAIAERLAVSLTAATRPMARPPTGDMEAYDLYLKGRYFWGRRGAHMLTAVDYFNRAVALDSRFAAPHAGLSDCYTLMAAYGYMSGRDAAEPARRGAYRALELDAASAESHYAVGLYESHFGWNLDVAERMLRRATEINPSWAFPHVHLSHLLLSVGDRAEARAVALRACELDPLSSLMHGVAAWGLLGGGFADDARRTAERAVELDDTSAPAQNALGLSRALDGRMEEAVVALQKGVAFSGRSPLLLTFLGTTLARIGRAAEARDIVSELENGRGDSQYAAMVLWQLGDEDAALERFERASAVRAPNFYATPLAAGLRTLVGDARWHALLRRVGLGSIVPAHALLGVTGEPRVPAC